MRGWWRRIGALSVLIAVLWLPSFFANAKESAFADVRQNARYQHFLTEVRCVVCQHQSIAESDAPLAKDLREKIFLQMQQGASDQTIREYLRDRYGEFILFAPAMTSSHWLLWGAPLLFFGMAMVLLIRFFKR